MRVPNLRDSPRLLQAIGLVLCGFVIGCAAMTAAANRTIQELHYDISDLRAENRSLRDQVENFEKVRNRRNIIDRTTVRWDAEQKDFGKATLDALRDRIAADLLKVVGKPVQAEMYELYRGLVDNKVYYDVNGADYRVRVTVLSVVGSECIVYVRAELFVPEQ